MMSLILSVSDGKLNGFYRFARTGRPGAAARDGSLAGLENGFLHAGQGLGETGPGAAKVEPHELAVAELGAGERPTPACSKKATGSSRPRALMSIQAR